MNNLDPRSAPEGGSIAVLGRIVSLRTAGKAALALGAIVLVHAVWPFYSVPTGSRGVVTQFGRITGIEGEGLAVLPPWQKLNNFSIRAEKADIESADGYPHFLVADDNGCYEIRLESAGAMGLITSANPPVKAVVRWAITSQDYFALTGRPLRAVSIQRLTQADYDVKSSAFYPHYLVTNSYSGPDKVTNFGMAGVTNGFVHGEVFEIRSLDYFTNGYGAAAALYTGAGSNLNSAITHLIPNETIPANGPIQRVIGTLNGTQTYILEQPTSAERPY